MPWRSPYFRWRMETYSGMWAEKMTLRDIASFIWAWKGEFFRFLFWTGQIEKEARRRP